MVMPKKECACVVQWQCVCLLGWLRTFAPPHTQSTLIPLPSPPQPTTTTHPHTSQLWGSLRKNSLRLSRCSIDCVPQCKQIQQHLGSSGRIHRCHVAATDAIHKRQLPRSPALSCEQANNCKPANNGLSLSLSFFLIFLSVCLCRSLSPALSLYIYIYIYVCLSVVLSFFISVCFCLFFFLSV